MRRDVGSGLFALAAIGIFVLYKNRENVRGVLKRQGINVPHRDELMDRLRVGADRLFNRAQERMEELNNQPRETLKEVG